VFFIVAYTDNEGDLLPINNDENLTVAVTNARPVLRLLLERKGFAFFFMHLLTFNNCSVTALSPWAKKSLFPSPL